MELTSSHKYIKILWNNSHTIPTGCVPCAQLCPTLCDSVHGIFQAGTLEQFAISSSRASFLAQKSSYGSCVSCTASEFFTRWAIGEVSWTAMRSNPSILKEINPEYSLEELILKLKLQYFGHLMWSADTFSLEKTLMQGKTEGQRRGRWQRMRRLESITD